MWPTCYIVFIFFTVSYMFVSFLNKKKFDHMLFVCLLVFKQKLHHVKSSIVFIVGFNVINY
jgi:hypothetical protein